VGGAPGRPCHQYSTVQSDGTLVLMEPIVAKLRPALLWLRSCSAPASSLRPGRGGSQAARRQAHRQRRPGAAEGPRADRPHQPRRGHLHRAQMVVQIIRLVGLLKQPLGVDDRPPSSPTSRPIRPSSGRRALRATRPACRTVCLASWATSPVSRSTSATASPPRPRSKRASWRIRRPVAHPRSPNLVRLAVPCALMRCTSPPSLRTERSSRSAFVGSRCRLPPGWYPPAACGLTAVDRRRPWRRWTRSLSLAPRGAGSLTSSVAWRTVWSTRCDRPVRGAATARWLLSN
jgi:hypothetical protein